MIRFDNENEKPEISKKILHNGSKGMQTQYNVGEN